MTFVRRSTAHGHAAYTLVELIIVIAVLGLASALLVPYLVGRDSLQVQAAVRQVIADLSFAQSDALAYQGYRRVHFYEDGRGYCLVRMANDGSDLGAPFDPDTADYVNDPLAAAGELGQYIVDFSTDERYEGVWITSADIDDDSELPVNLHYGPLGGTRMAGVGAPPGLGGQIVIASDEYSYEITIAPFTGKLTVRKLP
ncbi:MAG: prepilin-type N-terminal cleavage/methylation domain-containing protein [Phycisphaerales bacterium]|nr:MAG: prepilin-type N-terminal cleavage/methylation domain-containing protein [Phycisphaerales bacterium]